ncbi:MAG: hypothetical protein AAB693_02600 [Patescibacteria group bacterium]
MKTTNHILPKENIGSNLHYPDNRSMLSPVEQVNRLKVIFPGLRGDGFNLLPSSNLDVDGILVVPNLSKIGWSDEEAMEKVFQLLMAARANFLNCRETELCPTYFRLLKRTARALETLKSNGADFFAFPVQLGRRYLGKSARSAHIDLAQNEFGLGPLEIALFLLTHPNWLSSAEDLGIDCIGCEYAPYGHGFFRYILFFYFKKYLKFEERWSNCPDIHFGPATGFLL